MLKLKLNIPQVLLSSKLGDGGFVKQGKYSNSYYMTFTTYHYDYACHIYNKLKSLGIFVSDIRTIKSGYKEGSHGYTFSTRIHPLLNKVGNISNKDAILKLNKEGLSYFFIDDGSFHQKKHFGHLYCNTFSVEECESLIEVMYKYYPSKRCSIRFDRKKDGRKFPYLYIPVCVMNQYKLGVLDLIKRNRIYSFMYKVGQPSQTIEKV